MMASAGGATHIVLSRETIELCRPSWADSLFVVYPGLTPWATSCRAYRRWITKGKSDINRPEVNLAWTKSFLRGTTSVVPYSELATTRNNDVAAADAIPQLHLPYYCASVLLRAVIAHHGR